MSDRSYAIFKTDPWATRVVLGAKSYPLAPHHHHHHHHLSKKVSAFAASLSSCSPHPPPCLTAHPSPLCSLRKREKESSLKAIHFKEAARFLNSPRSLLSCVQLSRFTPYRNPDFFKTAVNPQTCNRPMSNTLFSFRSIGRNTKKHGQNFNASTKLKVSVCVYVCV